jgi:hypothetical protein
MSEVYADAKTIAENFQNDIARALGESYRTDSTSNVVIARAIILSGLAIAQAIREWEPPKRSLIENVLEAQRMGVKPE